MWYIIFREILGETVERWYYGGYRNCNKANEVALELGRGYCVVTLEEAREMGVLNIPFYL